MLKYFKSRPTWPLLVLGLIAFGFFLAGQPSLALAMPPGQYGAVTCGDGGTCALGSTTATVPAGALPSGYTLVVYPPPAGSPIPPAAPGTVLVGDLLYAEVHDAQGNIVNQFTPSTPFSLCMTYTSDQLAQAGGDANNFRIRYFDTAANAWNDVGPTSVDAGNSRVCVNVAHLTLFGLFALTPSSLPVTGGEMDSGSWWLVAAAAMVLVAGGLVLSYSRRQA